MNMSKYLDLFLSEAREHLSAVEEDLARLEESPHDQPRLQELFRHAHSIKGMAASMGFPSVAALAHGIEDLLNEVKRGAACFDSEMRRSLSSAFDAVDGMVSRIGTGNDADVDIAPYLESLARFASRSPQARTRSASGSRGGAPLPSRDPAPADAGEATRPVAGPPQPAASRPLRVDLQFAPDSYLPAARAAVALKRLEARGRVLQVEPSLGDLAAREFRGHLSVFLETSVPASQIREELRAMIDVTSVEVGPAEPAPPRQETAVTRSRPAPLPEPPRLPPSGTPARAEGPPEGMLPVGERAEPPPARSTGRRKADEELPVHTLRIPAQSLDRFLDAIGELIVQRGRLASLLVGRSDRSVSLALGRLRALVDRLYGEVMALRMVPFDSIAHRFTRSVRELADAQGKKVALRIQGRDVLLDRSMLDELTDPINHVLRNAIDHGIETPAERLAAGKTEGATIALRLERAGDSVTLRIEDDGRGMDPGRIRRAAVAKGYIGEDAAVAIGDAEALMLTTIPGFSTADRITAVSGRGVGMDVVRTRVETLGGRLTLMSPPGSGLAVEMRLPLTLVVVQAFLVEAGGRSWAVPISSVARTFEVRPEAVVREGAGWKVAIDEDTIPLFDLSRSLELPHSAEPFARQREALVSSEHGRSVAFAVERILGRREIVVRPLGPPLEELRGFSGATLLDDGEIALILDLLSLARP